MQFVDRPDGDARDIVAVQGGDPGDQRIGQSGGGLEDRGDLVGGLDRALPAVDRAARAEDVDAGVEAFLDHLAADALRFVGVGEDRVDRDDGHGTRLPCTCAPQTVAATSSAATAWWSAARPSATPVRTVAMPSRIWVPNAEWMAIEARRSSGRTRRAKITSA